MAADQTRFEQLLSSLLCADKGMQKQAQEADDQLDLDAKVKHLLAIALDKQQSDERRQKSAVLLEDLLSSDFEELPKESKALFLEQILQGVRQNDSPSLRRKICEVIAKVTRCLIDPWPELLQFLNECANSTAAPKQEAALIIFENAPNIFEGQESQYLSFIKHRLAKSLNSGNAEVRLQAVRASGRFMLHLMEKREKPFCRYFADFLPRMVIIMAESIEGQRDKSLLRLLVEMASGFPRLLRPQLKTIFRLCAKALHLTDVCDEWRNLAVKVMIKLRENSFASDREFADKHITALIPKVVQNMTLLDEDAGPVLEFQEECDFYQLSLTQITECLGLKAALPRIMDILPTLLHHEDWKHRYAAMNAISSIWTCFKEQHSENLLDQTVPEVLKSMKDAYPRVRFAACSTFRHTSILCRKKYLSLIVRQVLILLDDVQNPGVQACAAYVLREVIRLHKRHDTMPYLDSIISKLETIISYELKYLVEKVSAVFLEQIVDAIRQIGWLCTKKLGDFYDRWAPCLKLIYQSANGEKFSKLRRKTLNCLSSFCFDLQRLNDYDEIIKIFVHRIRNNEFLHTDVDLFNCWIRMCEELGEPIKQFMQLVESLLSPDNVDIEHKYHSLIACKMLECYAYESNKELFHYAETALHLIVPLLKSHSFDVRITAAKTLSALLYYDNIKENHWTTIKTALLEAIRVESKTTYYGMIEVFIDCLDIISTIDDEWVQVVEITDEGFPAANLVYVLHKHFNIDGATAALYFEKLVPHCVKLLDPGRQWSDKHLTLEVFGDAVEYLSEHRVPACIECLQNFTPALTQYVLDENSKVRQAAARVCGRLAQFGGDQFAGACSQLLPILRQAIEAPGSRDPEYIVATEFGIAAVAKILQHNKSAIRNINEVIDVWLSWLPVIEDVEAASVVYELMCDLIEARHPVLLEAHNQRRITLITAEVLFFIGPEEMGELGSRMSQLSRSILDKDDNTKLEKL